MHSNENGKAPYNTREEYDAWVASTLQDQDLSPAEKDDLLAGHPVPEETIEEALERHKDE